MPQNNGKQACYENLLLQHVAEPTRQRGSDKPHTLDLIISSDNFVSEVEYLSPLGMSDHSVLKFSVQLCTDKKKQQIDST